MQPYPYTPGKVQHSYIFKPWIQIRIFMWDTTDCDFKRSTTIIRPKQANWCGNTWFFKGIWYRTSWQTNIQTREIRNKRRLPQMAHIIPHQKGNESSEKASSLTRRRGIRSSTRNCPWTLIISMPDQWPARVCEVSSLSLCRWLPTLSPNKE